MLCTRRLVILASILTSLLSLVSACAPDAPLPEGAEVAQDGPPLGVAGGGKADGLSVPAYAALPEGANLSAPLQVLFAPDDPVTTLELSLIDEVIAARAADPRAYDEGANPYRVRYAVYNLRNPDLVDRLVAAERAGVDVQVLIEADQLDPEKTWNIADERFAEAGLTVVPTHKGLSAAQVAEADLIGVTGSGLMHLKARLFETPGAVTALTGSLNPGDNAVLNEETLHLIRDERLALRYRDAYETVLRGDRFANQWDDEAGANVLFTPQGAGPRAVEKVFEWLDAEQEQILLMVFSLRDISAPGHQEKLVELLSRKARAGVPVFVITDRKQSDGVDADGNKLWFDDSTEDRLRAGGVHVYEAINEAGPFNAMHHKVAVLGRTNVRVITDAANWTAAGLGTATRKAKNVESQLFLDSAKLGDPTIGHRYLAQWLLVLSRYAGQEANRDELPYADAEALLLGSPGWPTLGVTFAAEVETAFGEGVWARGDATGLGDWGRSSEGVPLTTDGDHYPLWTSATPASLPLGTTFRWKLVSGTPDRPRWERGDDRTSTARLPALLTTPTSHHVAVWR